MGISLNVLEKSPSLFVNHKETMGFITTNLEFHYDKLRVFSASRKAALQQQSGLTFDDK